MSTDKQFYYTPDEGECVRASNSYLISLVLMVAGAPIPFVGLFANVMFYLSNRRASHFVRWHTMQALVSQFSLWAINTVAFWWIWAIAFGDRFIDNNFISYMITVTVFNISEMIATIYTVARTRNGHHVEWWFYSDLTDLIVKPDSLS
ncbi:MAG: hypothetical protein ACM3ME_07985 [Chloroflexota bacterium]|jgi:uncharacterized membrane protein|nr:hypothetical protein [Lentimicrobium sp.]